MSEHAYSAPGLPRTQEHQLRPSAPRGDGPSPSRAMAIAFGCILGMAIVWAVAELVPAVHVRDAVLLRDFTELRSPHVERVANALLHPLQADLFVLWGVALVAGAVARGRPRLGVAVAVIMGMAPLTSELLKPLLAHPHAQVGELSIAPASWPSGHSTAALALSLSAALVAPRRLRGVVIALGVTYSLAAGAALLILAWHMPSDVIGGYLVAGLWTALAVAALRFSERRRPPPLLAFA